MNAEEIRARLDHPILDADGHMIEYLPILRDFVVEEGGEDVAQRFDGLLAAASEADLPVERRRELRIHRKQWWALPTAVARDRATATLPGLFYERLDEFGIDFAVLYPSYGLIVSNIPDAELRRAWSRACNRYYSEVMLDHRDRLEPVATIPMVTPGEAIAELDFAVGERGLKAVVMSGVVLRPLPGAVGIPGATYVDTVAYDSAHDYDPVWQRCVELGVAPTFHGLGSGWGSRTSSKSWMFNHIGHFATAQEAACRSIVFGGVPDRFPRLRFSFLEGGVAWASNLCSDIIGHWEKRNIGVMHTYDPEGLDRGEMADLVTKYGGPHATSRLDRLDEHLHNSFTDKGAPAASEMDEFADSRLTGPDDVIELFANRFYFGCEADDPMTSVAFTEGLPPVGRDLRPVLGSDIGHFDVSDPAGVIPEAWELVDHGYLDHDQFRALTFANAARLWATQNPRFFDGTSIEGAVRAEIAAPGPDC